MNTQADILQRFLLQEGFQVPLEELWLDPQRQRVSAYCYLECSDHVLMLRRNKEPFAGYWTAPGGKLQFGEDPRQAVMREMNEETGLFVQAPSLRLVVAEISPNPLYNWLLFVFRTSDASGQLRECQEGTLRWVPHRELATLKKPTVDAHLLPLALEKKQRYVAHVSFHDPPEGMTVRTRVCGVEE